jgi:DNA-binding NtrC family response regulator
MTLFCNDSVILPEHVVFPSDLKPDRAPSATEKLPPVPAGNHQEADSVVDLSLEHAMQKHVRFVYDQANQNQRRAARLLGISRSTLSRYLRDMPKNKAPLV